MIRPQINTTMAELREIENGNIVTRKESEATSTSLERTNQGKYFMHIRTKDFEIRFNDSETRELFSSRVEEMESEFEEDLCFECHSEAQEADGLCSDCWMDQYS